MQTLNAQRMSAPTMKKIALTALVAAAVLGPAGSARAESNFQTAAGALSAPTHLDFQIVIPKVLYLRVGTGSTMATNAAVDQITFTVPAANVGDSSVIAGTGGDLTGGVVTARVIANSGTVTFTTATPNQLLRATGTELISYSQIKLVVGTNTTGTALTPPAMTDNSTTSTTIAPTANVVNQDAKWTFTYLNTTVPAAGTYGGSANQGRVTYTASIL